MPLARRRCKSPPTSRPHPPKDALWFVIRVDVMPPHQDREAKLLERWAEASRGELGNRRFDVAAPGRAV